MKRFNFTLDKLYDYKDQVLSKEKNDLAELRSSRAKIFSEKEELEYKLRMSGEEFAKKAAVGMSIMEITMFKDFHKSLEEKIHEKEEEISDMEGQITKQLGVVVEASKDVNSLERLSDKAVEIHKLNQQFILDSLAMVAKFAGATLLGAAVILGANGKLELPDIRK